MADEERGTVVTWTGRRPVRQKNVTEEYCDQLESLFSGLYEGRSGKDIFIHGDNEPLDPHVQATLLCFYHALHRVAPTSEGAESPLLSADMPRFASSVSGIWPMRIQIWEIQTLILRMK